MELTLDNLGGNDSPLTAEGGLHEAVENAVVAINLGVVCALVARNQNWGKKKTTEVEKGYRKALSQFALAFEGVGLVSDLKSDIALLWQAHSAEGQKFASDMHSVVMALLRYRGKSLDEKFPGPTD